MTDAPAGAEWLIDKSALVRLGVSPDAETWAQRIQRGLVHIATVTLLEIGYCARDARDLDAGLHGPPVGSMPVQYATPVAEDRAVQVVQMLADRGHRRAPSVPDLIVAALAEAGGLIVLHNDKDFDLIAPPRSDQGHARQALTPEEARALRADRAAADLHGLEGS